MLLLIIVTVTLARYTCKSLYVAYEQAATTDNMFDAETIINYYY